MSTGVLDALNAYYARFMLSAPTHTHTHNLRSRERSKAYSHESFWGGQGVISRLTDPFGRLSELVVDAKKKGPALQNDNELWEELSWGDTGRLPYTMIEYDARSRFSVGMAGYVQQDLRKFRTDPKFQQEAKELDRDKIPELLRQVIDNNKIPAEFEFVRDFARAAFLAVHKRENATEEDVHNAFVAGRRSIDVYEKHLEETIPYHTHVRAGTPMLPDDDDDDDNAAGAAHFVDATL